MSVLTEKDTELNKAAPDGDEPRPITGREAPAAAIDPAKMAVMEEMMKAGLFVGRRVSKTHPRMKPYIFGVRNGASVIDLEESSRLLNSAMEFVKEKLSSANKTLLLVGTQPTAKSSVEEFAKRLNLPYVTERWLGGTLTNFKTLSKRIDYFKKLKSDKETGRLEKYTKKERLDLDRQIQKMTKMFSGIEQMDFLPDVLVVVDVNAHLTAVREAKRVKIPIVGILNTDTDPELVNYPIPANDRSKLSIDWVLAKLEKAVEEGRQIAKSKAAEAGSVQKPETK